jgi:hypothetical protein
MSMKMYHNPLMDSSEAWALLGLSLLVAVPSYFTARHLAGASTDFVPQQFAILLFGLAGLGLAGVLPALQSLIFFGFLEIAIGIGCLLLPLVYLLSLAAFFLNSFSFSKTVGILTVALLVAWSGWLWLWRNATWPLVWRVGRRKAAVAGLLIAAIGAGMARAGSIGVLYYAWGVVSVLAGSVAVLSGARRLPDADDWFDPRPLRDRLPRWIVSHRRFREDPAAWPSTSQSESPFLAAALLAVGLALVCGGIHNVTATGWAAASNRQLHKQAVAVEFMSGLLGDREAK